MNPLLRLPFEIPFGQIKVEHIVPAVRQLLQESQAAVDAIANMEGERTFVNTMLAFDRCSADLEHAMAVVRHMGASTIALNFAKLLKSLTLR